MKRVVAEVELFSSGFMLWIRSDSAMMRSSLLGREVSILKIIGVKWVVMMV